MSRSLRLAPLALLALSACSTEGSREYPTGQLYPLFEVRTDASGLSAVSALLQADFFTTVVPEKGDRIVVTGGSGSTTLGRSGQLQSGTAGGTAFRFDFQRPRHESAPDSTGTLPPPMTLTAPAAGSSYRVPDDTITLRWTEFGGIDPMSVQIQARCTSHTGTQTPLMVDYVESLEGDVGLALLPLDGLDRQLSSDCRRYEATLILRRSREGVLDRRYAPSGECERDNNCIEPPTGFALRQVRPVAITLEHPPES